MNGGEAKVFVSFPEVGKYVLTWEQFLGGEWKLLRREVWKSQETFFERCLTLYRSGQELDFRHVLETEGEPYG